MQKELIFFHLLITTLSQQLPYPLMMPYNNGAFNSFFDGPNGQKGFWGQLPPSKNNIFNSDWKNNGYKQMYNMNSIAPFAQDRMTGYDAMMPYYTPMANSVHSYYPVLQKYNADGQIDPLNKDLNSKQYEAIYKQYHDFYSKDLNRLNNLWSDLPPVGDLNNDHDRRLAHPESYVYDNTNYFDKFSEDKTLPGPNLRGLTDGNPRERYLKDSFGKRESYGNLGEHSDQRFGKIFGNGYSVTNKRALRDNISRIKDKYFENPKLFRDPFEMRKKRKRKMNNKFSHDFDESIEEEQLKNEVYNMKKNKQILKSKGLKVVYDGKKNKVDYEKIFDKMYKNNQRNKRRVFKPKQIV